MNQSCEMANPFFMPFEDVLYVFDRACGCSSCKSLQPVAPEWNWLNWHSLHQAEALQKFRTGNIWSQHWRKYWKPLWPVRFAFQGEKFQRAILCWLHLSVINKQVKMSLLPWICPSCFFQMGAGWCSSEVIYPGKLFINRFHLWLSNFTKSVCSRGRVELKCVAKDFALLPVQVSGTYKESNISSLEQILSSC